MAQVNYEDNGLVFITKQTFSGVSSVSFDNCFSATYSQYKIIPDLTGSAATDVATILRAGGVNTSTNNNLQLIAADSTTITGIRSTSVINMAPIYTNHNAIHMIEILNPFQSTYTTAFTFRNLNPATNPVVYLYATGTTITTSFDGLSFVPGTGTITGTIYIYGYKES